MKHLAGMRFICAGFVPVALAWCALGAAPDALPAGAASDELQAGAAARDITPPVGYRMSGYFSERLATGVRDPLFAKALVLRQGESAVALVCCDLIGMPRTVSDAARRRAAEATGIPFENIAVCCTHSHTGPLYAGVLRDWFHEQAVRREGRDAAESVDYPSLLVEQIAAAVGEAHASLAPARLACGVVDQQPQLSFNRRFHMKDGSVRFNPGQRNPDIVRPAGPIDPEVGVVLAQPAAGGRPRAVLTVFAMHLDTLGGTLYSADYPHHLEQALRQSWGESLLSLFGAGTCGDINHIDVTRQDRRTTEEIGRLLAASVLRAAESASEVQPSLAARSKTVTVPLQTYTPEELQWAKQSMPLVGTRELEFLEQVRACKVLALAAYSGGSVELEVQAIRLGDDLALVTLPGEVLVELGLAIKRASPFARTLVIELANHNPAYVPTRKAFAEGSYETVNSVIAPGGGELLVEAALELLEQLRPR
jgi:hypothetical protein